MTFTNLLNISHAWMHLSTYPETMITGHWKYIKMLSKREKQAPTMYRVSHKTDEQLPWIFHVS